MAKHDHPTNDGVKVGDDLLNYVNSPRLTKYAKKGIKILMEFPNLTVWKVQYKDPNIMVNNAWYIGFIDRDDPFIINYTITQSNIDVVFRYSQYLPPSIFDNLKCAKGSIWKYGDINTFGHNYLTNSVHAYLNNIKNDFYSGKLKKAGRSFVECLLYDDLSSMYPHLLIERNKRLDSMRSEKNKPLEFDLYIKELGFAVEVQGPQHFEKIYGDNDQLQKNDGVKKEWAYNNGVKLMWVNWKNFNDTMIHRNKKKRLSILTKKLNHFLSSNNHFHYWK